MFSDTMRAMQELITLILIPTETEAQSCLLLCRSLPAQIQDCHVDHVYRKIKKKHANKAIQYSGKQTVQQEMSYFCSATHFNI